MGTPKNETHEMKSSSHNGLVIDKSETNKINRTTEIIKKDTSNSSNNIQDYIDDMKDKGAYRNDTHVPEFNSKNEFVKNAKTWHGLDTLACIYNTRESKDQEKTPTMVI